MKRLQSSTTTLQDQRQSKKEKKTGKGKAEKGSFGRKGVVDLNMVFHGVGSGFGGYGEMGGDVLVEGVEDKGEGEDHVKGEDLGGKSVSDWIMGCISSDSDIDVEVFGTDRGGVRDKGINGKEVAVSRKGVWDKGTDEEEAEVSIEGVSDKGADGEEVEDSFEGASEGTDEEEVGVIVESVLDEVTDGEEVEGVSDHGMDREGDSSSEAEHVSSEEEDDLLSKSKRTKDGSTPTTSARLVAVRDNIPDGEFTKMLSQSRKASTSFPDERSTLSVAADAACQIGPTALILVPTRELAMQIHSHLIDVAKYTKIKVLFVCPQHRGCVHVH